MESNLTNPELEELWGGLNFNDAFGLPNMVPQVSHGMTHWVKLDDGSNSHEACAYHVDNFDGMQLFCDAEKDPAVRWSNTISHILSLIHI